MSQRKNKIRQSGLRLGKNPIQLDIEVVAWADASLTFGQDSETYNNTAVQMSVGSPLKHYVFDKWGKAFLRLIHNSHFGENDFINIPVASIIHRTKIKVMLPEKLRNRE